MPHNFLHLGLIRCLFPRVPIIHVVRNPLDTCLSCYFKEFAATHAYSCELMALGRHYRAYQTLMRHWQRIFGEQILQVEYEGLIDNPELQARRLLQYCGLEWEPGCLRFYDNDRVVTTASADQVRQPIYSSSVGRWRHYQSKLEPLVKLLDP